MTTTNIQELVIKTYRGNGWKRLRIEGMLVLITAIWGGTFLVVQNSIKSVGPFSFISLRFVFAALTLAVLFNGRLRRISKAELFYGGVIGLFMFAGYVMQTLALQYTTSSKVGFITGLYVAVVPALAIVLLRQWPTAGAVIGSIMAIAGLALLATGNGLSIEFGLGEWLALGCAIAFAFHIIFVSKFAPGRDAINLTIVQIAVTALLSLIAVPVSGEAIAMPSSEVWLAVIFMGVVATAFTFAVMNQVQQQTTSNRAALIYALEPVFAGMFGYLAGETLGVAAIIGCSLIFLGSVSGEIKLLPSKSAKRR